ncbi:hypothetical protein B0E52_13755 [Rhodanobacter sp. C06]|nr:hypothetical protein [Rhodanobacter glycinis]OOG38742.1 hypothetical protein B0E52_13755 [Rhodanobacter sp. C06]
MKDDFRLYHSLCARTMAHHAVYQQLLEATYGPVNVALLDAELHPTICVCWIYEESTVTEVGGVQRQCSVDTSIVFRAEMCELTNRRLCQTLMA